MSPNSIEDDKALAWAREELDRAVQEITDQGVIDSPLVESRLAWSKPFEVVIGQLRDQGDETEFLWIVGGTVPVDCAHSRTAATPREAVRHFSMKWQLDAARYQEPATRERLALDPSRDWQALGAALVAKAEFLYAIFDDERLWS